MPIGSTIFHSVHCTNSLDWAKSLIEDAPHGTLLIADFHEYTRGRQGRIWQQMPGQVLPTFILKPDKLPCNLTYLNMSLSSAIANLFTPYNITLKWPNDFMHGQKKMGGMLLEAIWQGETLKAVIVGFGLNIDTEFEYTNPLYATATSLRQIAGHPIKSVEFYTLLNNALEKSYQDWMQAKISLIYSTWKRYQSYLDKVITVHRADGSIICGTLIDVFENGNALIQTKSGREEVSL